MYNSSLQQLVFELKVQYNNMKFNYRAIPFAILLKPHSTYLFYSVSLQSLWFWPKFYSGSPQLSLNILSKTFIESTVMMKLELIG